MPKLLLPLVAWSLRLLMLEDAVGNKRHSLTSPGPEALCAPAIHGNGLSKQSGMAKEEKMGWDLHLSGFFLLVTIGHF